MRRRGSGTFVQAASKEVNLLSLAGTTSAFHEEGISVATTLLAALSHRDVGGSALVAVMGLGGLARQLGLSVPADGKLPPS